MVLFGLVLGFMVQMIITLGGKCGMSWWEFSNFGKFHGVT